MNRIIAGTLTAIALGFGPAQAVTWDTNDDGSVNAEEFVRGHAGSSTFQRFDDNNDNVITPAEVGLENPDEVFMKADENDDGQLNREELGMAAFMSYDTDLDMSLDTEEWDAFERDQSIRETPFGGPGLPAGPK